MSLQDPFIHESSIVSGKAHIGSGTKIWHHCVIREDSKIGKSCIFGKGVYVDFGVHIGDHCKIQNNSSLYHGATIEDGVFIGPHVILTNDKSPRAINPDGSLKGAQDWECGKILIKKGASIGAGSIILTGVTIGEFAMVGAGSVVTKDVEPNTLVFGNPAKKMGLVCSCGNKAKETKNHGREVLCESCLEKLN